MAVHEGGYTLSCRVPPTILLIVMGISRVASHTSIRFATEADLNRIFDIDRLSFPKGWDYDTFKSSLKHLFFIFEEKEILGFLVAWYSEIANSAMIMKIAVHPDHRNKGIGTRLIEAVLDELTEMNVREVTLHVDILKKGPIELYERLGFKIVKVDSADADYEYEDDESFYLMRLKLGNK